MPAKTSVRVGLAEITFQMHGTEVGGRRSGGSAPEAYAAADYQFVLRTAVLRCYLAAKEACVVAQLWALCAQARERQKAGSTCWPNAFLQRQETDGEMSLGPLEATKGDCCIN